MINKIDGKNIHEFISELNRKSIGPNIFLFVMGMLVSALALNLFFQPYEIFSTGSNGLALLVGKYIPVSMSLIIFVISLILLIIGLISFGFGYASKMLLYTFLYPFFVSATTLITRYVDLEDTSLFLIVVIGGGMMGLSSGLIRKSGYSPGGFCVIYDLMSKYFHLSIGVATLIINAIMVIASAFIFSFESAIYAVIALLVSSYIVDKVVLGISDNKVFYVITSKPNDVRDYIIDKLNYSVTIVNAKGGYTHKNKKMLMCVVPTIEYVGLKEIIRAIDDGAFFLIVDAYETSVKRKM